MTEPLLSVRGLTVEYVTPRGSVAAVEDVSFDVHRGEFLGLAGESGSGKSTLIKALLRILPPPGIITAGDVRFDEHDLLALPEPALRQVRWRRISMVFQSAMDALNPVLTVREQIDDTLEAHGRSTSDARVAELLELVGVDPARSSAYPHELSGGMRQRVGIAIALCLEPELVIMDEPTTALDVVVERAILDQLRRLQETLGFAVLFITHDLPRMLQLCGRMGVMYSGLRGPKTALTGIPGAPPSLHAPPPGCRFAPRCGRAVQTCHETEPPLAPVADHHLARCPVAPA